MRRAISTIATLFLVPAAAFSDSFPPNTTLVRSYSSSGLYNLVGLDAWNGQPLSPTNYPSDANRELDATINLFVLNSSPNDLYVQLASTTTTIGAYWFGSAFDDVTQTGIQIIFPAAFGAATLSSNYANPGEILADGTSGTEIDSPLTSTPGYALESLLDDYAIVDSNGAENGFTSLGGIYGATRIRGGGLFLIQFTPSVNFFDVNFNSVDVFSLYGDGGANQSIQANLVPESGGGSNDGTAEPSTWSFLIIGLLTIFGCALLKKSAAARA